MTVSLSAVQELIAALPRGPRGAIPETVDGKRTLWGAFAQHKRDAKKRDIAFEFSFEDWISVWLNSGQLENRGPKLGQYVMARFEDVGPYSTTNVKIISAAENHQEANVGSLRPKSPEQRRKISEANKGKLPWNKGRPMAESSKEKLRRPKTEEQKRKLSLAKLGVPLTAKHKANISASLHGVPKSPQHRELLRQHLERVAPRRKTLIPQ